MEKYRCDICLIVDESDENLVGTRCKAPYCCGEMEVWYPLPEEIYYTDDGLKIG